MLVLRYLIYVSKSESKLLQTYPVINGHTENRASVGWHYRVFSYYSWQTTAPHDLFGNKFQFALEHQYPVSRANFKRKPVECFSVRGLGPFWKSSHVNWTLICVFYTVRTTDVTVRQNRNVFSNWWGITTG